MISTSLTLVIALKLVLAILCGGAIGLKES